MVLDTAKSFFDNVYDRLRTPFGGTLIAVWIYLHWEVVYSLFAFDKTLPLANRLLFIRLQFSRHSDFENYVLPILIAIGIIILYQVMSFITKAIIDLFSYRATPWMADWVSRGMETVPALRYQLVQESLSVLRKQLKELRDEYSSYEKQIRDLGVQNTILQTRNEHLEETNKSNDTLVQELKQIITKDEDELLINNNEVVKLKNTITQLTSDENTLREVRPKEIFRGPWRETIIRQGILYENVFRVDEKGVVTIATNNSYRGTMSNILINDKAQTITFDIRVSNTTVTVHNKLFMISDTVFSGEQDGNTIRYEIA